MSLNIVQNLVSQSTSNAPSTATINCTATQAGSLLFFLVTATSSGTPSIASPGGGWVPVYNVSVAGLAYALFVQLSNAGGITTITSNLTATTAGGATAGFLELTGLGGNVSQDFTINANQATIGVPWPNVSPVIYANELLFYAIHRVTSTFTASNTIGWAGPYANTVSTGSTTNAQQSCFLGLSSDTLTQEKGGGTLSSAVLSAIGYARFLGSTSFLLNFPFSPAGGGAGIYTPIFYSGMIGG